MTDRISSLVVADADIAAAYAEVMGQPPSPSELHYAALVVRKALAHAKPLQQAPVPERVNGEPEQRRWTKREPWPRRAQADIGGLGVSGLEEGFRDGLRGGIAPFVLGDLSVAWAIGQDVMLLRLRQATVEVSGLDVMRAEDPKALGHDVGRKLAAIARAGEGHLGDPLLDASAP